MLGTTIRYATMLGMPAPDGEAQLLAEYGGIDAMLDSFREQGIDSLELSMLSIKKSDASQAARIAEDVMDRGFHLTVHGLLENISGKEHFDFFSDMYEAMMAHQGEAQLTVHSLKTRAETAACLESFSTEAWHRYPESFRIALENQRIHNWDGSEAHLRISALHDSLPDCPNVGICWDFGHYGYNQLLEQLPLDGLPPVETMKRVIHTHIHNLKDLDTHHPLTEWPANSYIAALKKVGYQGVYNLELVTRKFFAEVGAKKGTDDSIRVLKKIVNME